MKLRDSYTCSLHGPSELLFETIRDLEPTPVSEAKGIGVGSIDRVDRSDSLSIAGIVGRLVLLDALSDCDLN